jgi:hypothetical protein
MTLIRDLIHIPERVNKGDYVLKLTEGVLDSRKTLAEYVVTEQLVKCFDHALGFIRSGVEGRTSKACYLHGSFGSGKSHFMAVLHLILQGDPGARGIPELAGVITRHNAWIQGKKFLLVPYHMIGQPNMESAILGGYVDCIQRNHPEARLPGVFLADELFANARSLRQTMGDETFFNALNQARTATDDPWGDLAGAWNPDRFERAVAASPREDERIKLVQALVESVLTSQVAVAKSGGEGYVSLDEGLSVISRHARELGYDALILFLDELILWLASHSADINFVQLEGQKLAKLVEAQSADRPAPVISFVARQRDLRDLVGKDMSGAAALNFNDILGHWEGRFDTVTLEDRNLPKIAQKRILAPKDETARTEMDAAFERATQVREEVLLTLLTSEGDREMFRQVYPFSPTLVQTLIAVSSLLQRERTALRVMLQLLVNQRDFLQLGDMVPVGDLFDVIAHGDDAFSEEMRRQFDNAKRLYHEKILPLLERGHKQRREALEKLPPGDPARVRFVNDDRLAKTLLLSALVPGVEPLRALTANRLAALNHGTIKAPIPGREGQLVSQKIKQWAQEIGEIKVGDEVNPTISLELFGVDTESIIRQAQGEDNEGNRVRCIRQLLFEQLGLENQDAMFLEHTISWRGTPRRFEIHFGNIRDTGLPDSAFEPTGDLWRLIIDYPFDKPPHGPMDDITRLEDLRRAFPDGRRTLAWVPSFFSEFSRKKLGRFVILDFLLTGDRYRQYAAHLSPQDQTVARTLLRNQRDMLRQGLLHALNAAFGLGSASEEGIDASHEISEHFQSLWPGFDPRPPAAPNLRAALEDLLFQALESQFPAHPEFETEIKTTHLKKVLDVAIEAARTEDGRVPVEQRVRAIVRPIANPLRLGEMAETHFVMGQHWKNHFNRKAAEAGGTLRVQQLRQWIDQPKPMGLPKAVQDLVILVFAEQTGRSFFHRGMPVPEPAIEKLDNEMELREQVLPPEAAWQTAVDRAGTLFGVAVSPLRNAANLADLEARVREKVQQWRKPASQLVARLRDKYPSFGLDAERSPRMKTAVAAMTLLERLSDPDGATGVVEVLADAEIETSEAAMGSSMETAAGVVTQLDHTEWVVFDDSQRPPGSAIPEIRTEVAEALVADEYAVELIATLRNAQRRAIAAISRESRISGAGKADPNPSRTVTPPVEVPGKTPGKPRRFLENGERDDLDPQSLAELVSELEQKLAQSPKRKLRVSWSIYELGYEPGHEPGHEPGDSD